MKMFIAGIELFFGFVAGMVALTVVAGVCTMSYYMLKATLSWMTGNGFH